MFPARVPLRLILVLACAGLGCRTQSPTTGLRVEVTLGGLRVDQLGFKVSNSGGILSPRQLEAPDASPLYELRPQTPAGPLADPQIIEIYLRDELGDTAVTCQVTGFSGGEFVRQVEASMKLTVHELAPLSIPLGSNDDGGVDTRPDGDAADRPPDGEAADRPLDGGAADLPVDGDVADAPRDSDSLDVAGDGQADGDAGLGPLGKACQQASECASGVCADGVCCQSTCGNCRVCNLAGKAGTCALAPVGAKSAMCSNEGSPCGFNGTCDGQGACFRPAVGTACGAAACQTGNFVPSPACDGQGACVAAVVVSCAPFACDATGATPHCRTNCTVQADCAAPAQCKNGGCGIVTKKTNGLGCVADGECTSGICADGVCCNARCTGPCQSCRVMGQVGTCTPVPNGKSDPHATCKDTGAGSCGTNGLCDGARGCARYPNGQVCQPAQCLGHAVISQQQCNAGACAAPAQMDCGQYRCDPISTICLTTCTTNAQCASEIGARCQAGRCNN